MGNRLIQIRPILFALGLMVCLMALAMALPAALDFADGSPTWRAFAVSIAIFAVRRRPHDDVRL